MDLAPVLAARRPCRPIHTGTNLRLGEQQLEGEVLPIHAFVRGEVERAFLVHDAITLIERRGGAASAASPC